MLYKSRNKNGIKEKLNDNGDPLGSLGWKNAGMIHSGFHVFVLCAGVILYLDNLRILARHLFSGSGYDKLCYKQNYTIAQIPCYSYKKLC